MLSPASLTTYGSPRAGTRYALCWFYNPLFRCPFWANYSLTHALLSASLCVLPQELEKNVSGITSNPVPKIQALDVESISN